MPGKTQGKLPTTTVSPARLRMCQPTQRPTYRQDEDWIVTSWGRCKVTGRFGQRHQDLLDAFLWNSDAVRETDDGGIELLVDPAAVRRTMSDSVYSMEGLKKLIRELREVTLEIETKQMSIIGGLIDHVILSPATKRDPRVAKRGIMDVEFFSPLRHLWRVRLGVGLAELLRHDLPLHYDPTPIARLQSGIAQAIARHILSHSCQPNGGWVLDNLIRSVCGELDSTMIRHRRRELRNDAAGLEAIGIFIEGERIVRRDSKPCSTRPIKAEKTTKRTADARCRAAPARKKDKTCSTRPILQDPSGSFRTDATAPEGPSHRSPRPLGDPPGGEFTGGEKGGSGANMQWCRGDATFAPPEASGHHAQAGGSACGGRNEDDPGNSSTPLEVWP